MIRIFQILASLLVILLITKLDLVSYGLRQAKGQFGIISGAVDTREVLDGAYSIELKEKLRLVKDVKQFAVGDLGLDPSDIYESINLDSGKYVMYVVMGGEPYRLVPYLWNFPVAGEVPYKGYFDLPLAIKERDRLIAEGWDAGIRTAGGWSTLGWFENPLLVEMLKDSTGNIVNLVLHEMAHETLYIPDSSELNENLATFIGDAGTEIYLKDRYGEDSPELYNYLASENDAALYSEYIIHSADRLDSLYGSFSSDIKNKEKDRRKTDMMNDILRGLKAIDFSDSAKYAKPFGEIVPNNTYFLSFIRYRSGQDDFDTEWRDKYKGDLKSYLEVLKDRYGD